MMSSSRGRLGVRDGEGEGMGGDSAAMLLGRAAADEGAAAAAAAAPFEAAVSDSRGAGCTEKKLAMDCLAGTGATILPWPFLWLPEDEDAEEDAAFFVDDEEVDDAFFAGEEGLAAAAAVGLTGDSVAMLNIAFEEDGAAAEPEGSF